MSGTLTREKALIFRITHRDNVPWIMVHGMHARNSDVQDPGFVAIGNLDLIEKRRNRLVPRAPHGTLSDYVPFYFTPFSPMFLNIKTGFNGVRKRPLEDIVIFVSSLTTLRSEGLPFLFTDRHANLATARFTDDSANLEWIDWDLLRRRDLRKDPEDPGKVERYQAEAQVYRHLPPRALIGVVCHNAAVGDWVRTMADAQGCTAKVIARPGWYV